MRRAFDGVENKTAGSRRDRSRPIIRRRYSDRSELSVTIRIKRQ
jgi:hypothetical protein